ncbi:MAG: HD domain-containing protein [bacterium]
MDFKNNLEKIENFQENQTITSFFIVRKSELRSTKNNKPYLHLELGDATGRIGAKLWDQAEPIYKEISEGDIIKVQGLVELYRETKQLNIKKIRLAKQEDNVLHRDFIPQTKKNIEKLWETIETKITSISNPDLKKLIDKVFYKNNRVEKFKIAPGGKLWHHAYIGGLCEHTLSVCEICESMSMLYPHCNRDLLLTGALLHDIGKIDEYGYEKGFIDFTDQGRLWGHISIGAQQVRKAVEEIEEESSFPEEMKKNIIHLILSHQGEYEHGSPVLPKTLEAIILYYSDEMDSKANAFQHIIDRDTEPGKRWSKYINLVNRFLYLNQSEDEVVGE